MPALDDSPARIVQRALILLGLADDPDAVPFSGSWPVYCERMPPQSLDQSIAVVNVLGQSDGRHQFDGELLAHFGFHVTVRARTGEEGWRRCELIRTGLAEDATGLVVTYRGNYYMINAATNLGQPFRVSEPGGDRSRYTLTGFLSVTTDFDTGTGTGTHVLDGHDILSVTDDGSGNALYTMAAPHGLDALVTLAVTVSGTTGGLYDGLQTFDTAPTSTTILSFGGYLGDSTGGRWDF